MKAASPTVGAIVQNPVVKGQQHLTAQSFTEEAIHFATSQQILKYQLFSGLEEVVIF